MRSNLSVKLIKVSQTFAVFAVGVGLMVILGWLTDNTLLKSIHGSFIAMNPLSALLFIITGTSVCFINYDIKTPFLPVYIFQWLALIVFILSLLKLTEVDIVEGKMIDELLFGNAVQQSNNRMSPVAAFNFLLVSIATILTRTVYKGLIPSQIIALCIFFVALFAAMDYLLGVKMLYSSKRITAIAVHTWITFFVISFALLLASPEKGLMKHLTARFLGGISARKLLPFAFFIPITLAYLVYRGEVLGMYNREFGTGLFAVAIVAVFFIVIWYNAKGLNRADIQLRKAHEEAFLSKQLSERLLFTQQFQFLADSIPQIVWTALPSGQIDYTNKNWAEYTGLDVAGSRTGAWFHLVHPDQYEEVKSKWEEALSKQHSFTMEYRLKRKSDGTYRWFLGRSVPMKDSQGNVTKWFGTATDIEDIKISGEKVKESEKQWREAATKLTKINVDLDNFVYMASHDLKAPIANMEGLMLAMNKKINDHPDEKVKKINEMIIFSIDRLKKTIGHLTEVSKIQKETAEDVERVYFKEILEAVEADLHLLISTADAVIISHFEIDSVTFSVRNFRSIIYNLVSNGIKYSHPDRKPEIVLKTFRKKNEIVLTVSDNGLGISQTQVSKLFGMFKRLHDHVEGSGIGLYIVKRNIENAGGRIKVESELGTGTTFKVYFRENKSTTE
jgi:PAS domain S-box-containing protein